MPIKCFDFNVYKQTHVNIVIRLWQHYSSPKYSARRDLGPNAKEIHRRKADVYGDSGLKYQATVAQSAESKHGRESLEMTQGQVVSQEMIDRV